MPFSRNLKKRFKQLSSLEYGWDDDEAIPVNTSVLDVAYSALQKLLKDLNIPEPEIGAVEDGRFDIFWEQQSCWFTLDKYEVCIHADDRNAARNISLDRNNLSTHLTRILKEELTRSNYQTKEIIQDNYPTKNECSLFKKSKLEFNKNGVESLLTKEFLECGTKKANESNKVFCSVCSLYYPEFVMREYNCKNNIFDTFKCKKCAK